MTRQRRRHSGPQWGITAAAVQITFNTTPSLPSCREPKTYFETLVENHNRLRGVLCASLQWKMHQAAEDLEMITEMETAKRWRTVALSVCRAGAVAERVVMR